MAIVSKNENTVGLTVALSKSSNNNALINNKGEWDPLNNIPNIEDTLITNGTAGDYLVVGTLSVGQKEIYDFGSKGGEIELTRGDEIYYNGVIFKKNDTIFPDASGILFANYDPSKGSMKDQHDILAMEVDTKITEVEAEEIYLKYINTI